jgi:hypothetical protein
MDGRGPSCAIRRLRRISIYTVFDPKHSIRSKDGQWADDLSRAALKISLEDDSLKSIGYYPNLERADMWESLTIRWAYYHNRWMTILPIKL